MACVNRKYLHRKIVPMSKSKSKSIKFIYAPPYQDACWCKESPKGSHDCMAKALRRNPEHYNVMHLPVT